MGIFDLFKKKKFGLTDDQEKWNKMWQLWGKGEIKSPYDELMTYQNEIYNGGHEQYFTNIEIIGDVQKDMTALETVLPDVLKTNLQKAYTAYLKLEEDEDDEAAEEAIAECDDVFYNNEEVINHILEKYGATLEL